MLKSEHLKGTPAREFAKGDGVFPELHEESIKWIGIWNGSDWRIKVAPSEKNFKEVAESGKVVDIPKIIQQIIPADSAAMELYFK